jgi:CHASE2 domain-containing sensor protein/tRNA A-37 threonylcarbamoyl transferase component Bud32
MSAKGRFLFDEQAREKRRWTLFAAGACAVAGVCMLLGIGQTFQLKIQDVWYSLRGDRHPSPQVVIVGIDGKSLNAQEERWPWPRRTYVPLIEKLNQAGAKVIGFDIAFSKTTAEDALLADAMRARGNVVFGIVFNDPGDRSPPSGAPPPEVVEQAVPPFNVSFLTLIPAPGVEPPSPELAEAAAGIGHVVLLPSLDGTLRRVPTLIQHGDRAYPSLAVQMARVYTDVPLQDLEVTASHVRIGYADIPITQTAEVLLNWTTKDLGNAFPTYSMLDVLRGDVGERELSGKAVFVAMTAEGLDDRDLPFGITLPGVLVHATFLENFFTLSFLQFPSWGIALEIGLFLALAVIAIFLFPRLPTPALLAAAPVLLLGVLGLSLYFFMTGSMWWPPLYPCLAIVFPFATSIFFKLRSTERAKDAEVEKVREAEEKIHEVQLEKGLAFQEKGSLDLAIATFNRLPMTEDMKMIYLNLGFDFQSRGNLEKAFLCYKRVYEMDPTFEDVAQRLEAMRRSGVGTQLVAEHSMPSVPSVMPPAPSVAPPVTPDFPDTGTVEVDEPEEPTLQMGEQETPIPERTPTPTPPPASTPTPPPASTPTPPPTSTPIPPPTSTPGVGRSVPGIEPQPGTSASRYRLIQKLGKGAMGEVSLMEDTKLDRKVAIKTIRPDVDMSSRAAIEMRQRFVREAKTAGKLTHPNIVTVYDSFEGEGGVAYIVMEFVEGETLANIIKKTRLTAPQIKHIIVNAASGLQHAHENGVFHRDVKPENIMISPKTGVTKLMDFGIARLVESNMTATGSVLGTPAYMAPEQVTGHKVDARSDIFSLGAVLYEMLTGNRAFPGNKITAVMLAVLQEEPPIPSSVETEPRVSPTWDPVVTKAMAKKAEERFQSAVEFANAVRAVRA